MIRKLFALASLTVLSTVVYAASTTAPAADPKAIGSLIQQLGHDEFAKREEAAQKLDAMGEAARPALREAAKASDPEIATRAQVILKKYEDSLPKAGDLVDADPPQGGSSSSTSVSVDGQGKTVELEEANRKVRIVENAGGIEMNVTTISKGKEVKQKFQAASADDLKRAAPKAHELYERCAGNSNIQINVVGQGAGFGKAVVGGGGNQEGASEMEKEMRKAMEKELQKHLDRLPAEQREAIIKQLKNPTTKPAQD
jgi:hypothetical protein